MIVNVPRFTKFKLILHKLRTLLGFYKVIQGSEGVIHNLCQSIRRRDAAAIPFFKSNICLCLGYNVLYSVGPRVYFSVHISLLSKLNHNLQYFKL